MPITVIWDNDQKTIVRYIYDGRWTWNDYYAARTETANLLATVNHKVGIIVDVTNSSLLPSGVLSRARQLSTTTYVAHDNEGMTLVVGANPFVRSVFDAFNKLYGRLAAKVEIAFVPSLEEARTMLAGQAAAR